MKTIRIFYRNLQGYDTAVMGFSESLVTPPTFRDKLMTDPENANVAYTDLVLENDDFSYQEVATKGAFRRKVENGALVVRDNAALDTDPAARQWYYEKAEKDIEATLQGRLKETWLMIASENIFAYLQAVQAAAGIADGSLSVAGQTAKATLAYISQTIATPANVAMTARDAALAALDPEV